MSDQTHHVQLDPVRNPPELIAYFEHHAREWRAGKVRLDAYCERIRDDDRRQWYPSPLSDKVFPDKADLFEAIGYRPSMPACLAHANLSKIRVFAGGARAGKSLWGGSEFVPLILSPDTRSWIVAPEYEQGRKEFEYILDAVETKDVQSGWGSAIKSGKIRNSPQNGDMEIRLRWSKTVESLIKVKSAERKRSLLSEELDAVMVVEASQIPQVVWSRYLQMRLTTRKGIAIFPSTPDGTGWYWKLYESGLHGDPGVFSISADSRMNPTMDLQEIAFWTDPVRMSDADFDEQVRGIPTPRHGRIYNSFDRIAHVKSWDPTWPKPSWRWGKAFDFGFKDPYVILWMATDGERWYVFDELYRSGILTDDVVQEIGKREGLEVYHNENKVLCLTAHGSPLPSVADWDAAERADLGKRGIRTRRARKDIIPGIRTLSELLKIRADGKPGIFISPKCKNLIREMQTYQWGPHGEPSLNQDDHALDAARYFVHTLAPHRRNIKIRYL